MPPVVFALISIFLWSGLAFLGLKLQHLPPFLLVGLALIIGSLCSLHRLKEWRAATPKLLAFGIFGLFGFHFFLFIALRNAPAIEVNLINYLWPLLIVLLAPLILPGTILRSKHIAAALLGFSGAILLATGGQFRFDLQHGFGYACALLSALIWSTYSLFTKRIASFPSGVVGAFCAVSGILSLLCYMIFEESKSLSYTDCFWILMMGIGPMGLAFFTWDTALKRGEAATIGSLSYLTPLFSTALLAATGAGTLSSLTLIAMILIIGGAVLGS
ncbi:MAG: EamA family transporter [Burkholderiaceae bacterium]|nr:EamA family transporter [Burkholderiaceae bacterium]